MWKEEGGCVFTGCVEIRVLCRVQGLTGQLPGEAMRDHGRISLSVAPPPPRPSPSRHEVGRVPEYFGLRLRPARATGVPRS